MDVNNLPPEKVFFYGKDIEDMTRDELMTTIRACAKETKACREEARRRSLFATDMMRLAVRR